jgi:hypothetical protein
MHRALTIPELLDMIMQYLPKGSPSLAALGGTCVYLNRIVVSILWESPSSLLPLIMLLPRDAISLGLAYPQDGGVPIIVSLGFLLLKCLLTLAVQCVTRALVPTDWTRFDLYAPHIRKLEVKEKIQFRTGRFQPDTSSQYLLRNDYALLPTLKHLRWSGQCLTNSYDVKIFHSFLSPTLVSLDIDPENLWRDRRDTELSAFVGAIQHASPRIVELVFRGVTYIERHREDSTRHKLLRALILPDCTLKKLHVDQNLFPSMQPYYSSLLGLESLVLEGYSWRPANEPLSFDSPSLAWKSLRELSGRGGSVPLRCLWGPLLPVIGHTIRKITLQFEPSYNNSADLLSIIGNSCPSLESLTISGIYFLTSVELSCVSELLRRLYSCSKLLELNIWSQSIGHDISLGLQDNDFSAISAAFQDLQALHFGSDKARTIGADLRSPMLTLNAIAILATRCLSLRSVSLTVDARHVPLQSPASGLHGLGRSSIRTINFGHSLIDDPESVAAYLGEVCPASGINSASYSKGEYVWTGGPGGNPFVDTTQNWKRVAEVMRQIQRGDSGSSRCNDVGTQRPERSAI